MPSERSREELLAQLDAIQRELAQHPQPTPPQAAIPAKPEPQEPHKVTQLTPGELPVGGAASELQLALVRGLLMRHRMPQQLRRRATKATPEEILAQITALKTVIISGVNSAGYGDKRTEFRSLAELRQIANDLEEELEEALGFGGRVRQIRMTTQADKGL